MEGQDPMTGTVPVTWHVAPLSPPQALRHCSTCGTPRPFRCSGKVRLNANGRRLDAWLIYKCSACDRTWNLPLLDRVPVDKVPPADLAAMQTSDPTWVHARAFDVTALRRQTSQVILPTELTVSKGLPDAVAAGWSRIALAIESPCPVGRHLDQLLAQELGLSRSFIHNLMAAGVLDIVQGPRQALKAPLAGRVVLHFAVDPIAASASLALARAFGLPPPDAGG
jgi:hypothetical protein